MARLPYADLDAVHERVRAAYDAIPNKLNLYRMLAHAERNFSPFTRLGGTILERQKLAPRLRELAILFVARESGATYEWAQHVPIARRTGVSEAQIEALARGEPETADFAEVERCVLRFAAEVVHDVRASDEALAALRAHLGTREVVELVLAVGYYMMVARVLETTGVDLEAHARPAARLLEGR
jgi:alkylhydroperoxidase family enzyme